MISIVVVMHDVVIINFSTTFQSYRVVSLIRTGNHRPTASP
jgi:hypothetical protein